MDLYGFNSAPTVIENHTVTGSRSGRGNIAIRDQRSRFMRRSTFTSAPITPRRCHDATVLCWGVLPYPFKTTLSFSIGFFLESPHHSFSQRSRPYPDHRSACTLHAFTVPQLRIREPATPHDRELGSRGMIAFSLPPLFFSFLHHVAAVDNSLQQLRVRVQLRIFINSSSIIFLKDLVLLVGFSSCPVFVCATIRVVVLVFSSNVPAIGLARLVFVQGLQTCRVSDFCFFCQFGIASHRFLSCSGPRNCRFPSSAVFRGRAYPVFDNTSQHRRDVIFLYPYILRYVAPGMTHWNFVSVFCFSFSCST